MSFLKKLFGGGGDGAGGSEVASESYKEFSITPTPIKEGGTYRVSARIEKTIDGETHSHTLVRADTVEVFQTAQEASVRKAKQVIDEQGDRIFK